MKGWIDFLFASVTKYHFARFVLWCRSGRLTVLIPKPVTMLTTPQALAFRYATKKFDQDKKLKPEVLETLLLALEYAPSSYGLQPWRFYLVENTEVRTRIKEAAYHQPQVTDASHLVALAYRTTMTPGDVAHFVERIKEVRGVSETDIAGYRDMMLGTVNSLTPDMAGVWNSRQVYLALGMLLTVAAHNEVDACPMEGFDVEKVSELVGATDEGFRVAVLVPLGYRSHDDTYAHAKKVRFPRDEVLKIVA